MASSSIRPRMGLCACLLAALAPLAGKASPPAWQAPVEIATGRGEQGPWRQNESRYDYVDDPSVVLDERGDAAVAWVDQARKDVFFQRFPAAGGKPPAAPVNVSRSPATFSWLPRLVVGAPHEVFVLWQEIIFSGGSHGGDILFARSRDGGASFSEPINLSNSIGGDGKGRITRDIWHNGSLDLARDGDGTLYAAWTEYGGALWFSRSGDGGGSFSRPLRVAGDDARPARAPLLAAAPGRTVYLAWTVGEDHGADIRIAQSADGGASFGEARLVAPSPTWSDAPRLAVDPAGVLHLAYGESVGGPFDAQRIRHTRSMDGGRSFEPSRDISAPLPPAYDGAAYPQLAVDARGRIYLAWELFAARQSRPAAQAMAVSTDGGRSFAAPVLVPGSTAPPGGTNGSRQGLLMKKLAVDADGSVAIVNSSLQPGRRSRVWLTRGRLPAGS